MWRGYKDLLCKISQENFFWDNISFVYKFARLIISFSRTRLESTLLLIFISLVFYFIFSPAGSESFFLYVDKTNSVKNI